MKKIRKLSFRLILLFFALFFLLTEVDINLYGPVREDAFVTYSLMAEDTGLLTLGSRKFSVDHAALQRGRQALSDIAEAGRQWVSPLCRQVTDTVATKAIAVWQQLGELFTAETLPS